MRNVLLYLHVIEKYFGIFPDLPDNREKLIFARLVFRALNIHVSFAMQLKHFYLCVPINLL